MTRTRTRYDVRKGDLLRVEHWTIGDPPHPTHAGIFSRGEGEWVLVLKKYGPFDDSIIVLGSTGVIGWTADSYILEQHRGKSEDSRSPER